MITLGGLPVLTGSMTVPRIGAWHADLEVGGEISNGPVVLTDDSAEPWIGTVYRSSIVSARTSLSLIGGLGGLVGDSLGANHWRLSPLSLIWSSTIIELGELPSPLTNPSILTGLLEHWTRVSGRPGTVLSAIAAEAGGDWRVLSDGTIWLGDGASRIGAAPGVLLLDGKPGSGAYEAAPDGFSVLPGDDIGVGEVESVTYVIGDEFRALVYIL